MTYLFRRRGPDYHWMPDLFQRMELPLPDGMKEKISKILQLACILLCCFTTTVFFIIV